METLRQLMLDYQIHLAQWDNLETENEKIHWYWESHNYLHRICKAMSIQKQSHFDKRV